ncbi:MAG: hypothetical protein JXB62_18330 [Pirellulales bacterium]|nr:hypothetical protein [Pirellulales bacterium]
MSQSNCKWDPPESDASPYATHRRWQFGVRQLLAFTFVISVMLATVRTLYPTLTLPLAIVVAVGGAASIGLLVAAIRDSRTAAPTLGGRPLVVFLLLAYWAAVFLMTALMRTHG